MLSFIIPNYNILSKTFTYSHVTFWSRVESCCEVNNLLFFSQPAQRYFGVGTTKLTPHHIILIHTNAQHIQSLHFFKTLTEYDPSICTYIQYLYT